MKPSNLIARIRERAFSSILRQDIEFYDGDEVTSGSLAAFLSTEANRLAGLSGSTLGAIVSAASAVIAAIAVSCGFGWKLALVCTATMPILLGCGYYRFHVSNFHIRSTSIIYLLFIGSHSHGKAHKEYHRLCSLCLRGRVLHAYRRIPSP